jgi:hypothetical protein
MKETKMLLVAVALVFRAIQMVVVVVVLLLLLLTRKGIVVQG